MTVNADVCPACGQRLPDRRGRICARCERPVARHDRWSFVGGRVEHRDCDDPQLAKLTAKNRDQRIAQATLDESVAELSVTGRGAAVVGSLAVETDAPAAAESSDVLGFDVGAAERAGIAERFGGQGFAAGGSDAGHTGSLAEVKR